MSFGIEVYTGAGRRRFSSNDSGVVPPKVLHTSEQSLTSDDDAKKIYINIGRHNSKAKNAFITLVNYNYSGSNLNRLPTAKAKLLPGEGNGNIVVVQFTIYSGTWGSQWGEPYERNAVDCQLWVLGV